MNKKSYSVIGLMSGTSCDGLDIAHCVFSKAENEWQYEILNVKSIDYSKKMRNKLIQCSKLDSLSLKKLDNKLGEFFSNSVKSFISSHKISADLISSHGHTVFHDIKLQLTYQIGNPLIIYKDNKIPVIYNFRELDVLFNGQGAPLVPFGERELFKGYNYCVNIGGIANISSLDKNNFYGYDICPANIILNYYARRLDYDFDINGKLSSKGILKKKLFNKLNNLKYYKKNYPKSLDLLFIEKKYFTLFKNYLPKDILKTFIEHMAYQINTSINERNSKVLLTGGGVFNNEVLKNIKKYNKLDTNFIVENKKLIIFKEAVIFGFLGLMRFLNKINVENTVTGAKFSTSSGLIIDNKII